MVAAKIFGDESSDEKCESVFAVAAIIGTDEQWEAFVPQWTEITEGKEFHAAKSETDFACDPDRSKHQRRLESYRKLTELIAWSGMHGWGVGIDLADYRKYFPHITQDMAYHKCFVEAADRLIADCVGMCHKNVEFTFDSRQGQGTTGILYEWIRSQPEWQGRILFANGMKFATRKDPRIQAADLLARETMKGLYHQIGSKPRPLRKSFITLASSCRHFQFDYLVNGYFAQMKSRLSAKIAREKRKYASWLKQQGAQDNTNSRHKFLIWSDTNKTKKLISKI
jgi:hypothetical protein